MTKLEKATKALDTTTLQEIEAMDATELKKRIVQANQSMEQAHKELEANPKYEALKEALKALSQGKRDVNKRQNAVITCCLHQLEERGDS